MFLFPSHLELVNLLEFWHLECAVVVCALHLQVVDLGVTLLYLNKAQINRYVIQRRTLDILF